jgi:hypothetical protein
MCGGGGGGTGNIRDNVRGAVYDQNFQWRDDDDTAIMLMTIPSYVPPGNVQGPPSLAWVTYLVQSWNVQGPRHSAQTVVYFRVTKEVNLKQRHKPFNNLKIGNDMFKFIKTDETR